jgi:hypothetical protein
MKKILNFFENLQFLFKPKYWIMLGKYDREWDIKINELAKEYEFKSEAGKYSERIYHVSLNGNHFWVGNYPYSFLVPVAIKSTFTGRDGVSTVHIYEDKDNDTQHRPSRLTIYKLSKKLNADLLKQGVTLKLAS